jgi:hypothetical protein
MSRNRYDWREATPRGDGPLVQTRPHYFLTVIGVCAFCATVWLAIAGAVL